MKLIIIKQLILSHYREQSSELLANGQLPPDEVVRPEVAEILIDFYKLNK